jgi:hypothetical protein
MKSKPRTPCPRPALPIRTQDDGTLSVVNAGDCHARKNYKRSLQYEQPFLVVESGHLKPRSLSLRTGRSGSQMPCMGVLAWPIYRVHSLTVDLAGIMWHSSRVAGKFPGERSHNGPLSRSIKAGWGSRGRACPGKEAARSISGPR